MFIAIAAQWQLLSANDVFESNFRVVSSSQTTALKLGLRVTPSQLRDGEDLKVQWNKNFSWSLLDFISITCGPQQNDGDFLFKVYVVRYSYHNTVVFYRQIMLRCDYVVRYHHFSLFQFGYHVIDKVVVKMKESFNTPKQGHLSFTSLWNEMVVMFNSDSNATEPMVRYGLSREALDRYASGTWTTYEAKDMCHRPATIVSQWRFRNPGFMHKVIMSDLHSGTRYYYQFGNDVIGWSRIGSFISRPEREIENVKFIAYGDMGGFMYQSAEWTAKRVFDDIRQGFNNFLLHVGDISYATGCGFQWDQFMHMIEPIATSVPYLVSVGNHEHDYNRGGRTHDPSGAVGYDDGMDFQPSWGNYKSDSSGECSVPLYHRFHAPGNGRGVFWYSFDYGPIHIVQISSEHDWRRNSEQYKWIEKDLKQVNRSATPWIVLTSHRMMYTTQGGEAEDLVMSFHLRMELEDLLFKYKVNLVITGHQHSYERTCRVRRGLCLNEEEQGPVHVVVGTAGADLEKYGFSSSIGKWSVSHTVDWGYLRFTVTTQRMQMQFVLSRTGDVFDQVDILPWK